MHLTREEEAVLNGEHGLTLQKAMEILTALGDIYNADSLIPIISTQIAGVSYKTIGDAGLEWISGLEGKVVVPSILNPAGMDLERWQEMGVNTTFAAKQIQIIEAYNRLGIMCECTCTPYHIDNTLAFFNSHLAWSESSAVSYANSVIGARTNREGGPSALAAALIGKTANYGYHLDENRIPSVTVRVECELKGADYSALGCLAGEMVGSKVVWFELRSQPSTHELKALGAAMAASGAVALYHIESITPEAARYSAPDEVISIERSQIDEVFIEVCGDEYDLIAMGCPHYSADELKEVSQMLDGTILNKEVWICTSRKVKEADPESVQIIEASGAKVFVDTCMVVSPGAERFKCVLTDSGKALKYMPGLCGVSAQLVNVHDCLNKGEYRSRS